MIPDERGQQLHDRATRGQALSPDERAQLDDWYAAQDRMEAAELGLVRTEVIASLQAQIDAVLILKQLLAQQAALMEEQQLLLEEQRRLLQRLFENDM